ncbi:MAG: argininosuccinate lyase [Bacillota bacterium]|uniref:Argininosuccinate lyase n=1 Tax=Thermanaerosceptrum fracticalcis TaxID=1712410 RepID=A0A7G6E5Z5_THEFR|nr:argininosuccinate lyase [Thermanaerosceptrum fracticalcis]QNB47499.1 argininosuccinate lyase [Thermanaerosceptrum fracticalcis]
MKLWGGRFAKNTDKLVEDFHSSISFDQRLYRHDIAGSIAHARMLGETGIIEPAEAEAIITGLKELLAEIEAGKIKFAVDAEDIHMNIETLLTTKIGPAGKKLHTARSRNDQVALDTRLFLKDEIRRTQELLLNLLDVLVKLADKHKTTIMPGYTHLQLAQPITLGHHLLAYAEMFRRDFERLEDCYKRTDVMPLGSGALAGTTFPLNRQMVAEELGFAKVSENSMDSVSDRDYLIEFLAAASLIMMHLSRFCEEIILWASQEFAFVDIDDAYSTGSSIMPQKKNPDVAELIRGKTGRVYGNLMSLLTVMKGLPMTYNKDMQEDKEALFDSIDTVQKCLLTFTPMLESIVFRQEKMYEAAKKGFSNATDLADYLVRKGLSFRDAHHVVGSLVRYCISQGKALEDLSLEEFRKGCLVIQEDSCLFIQDDVYEALKLENVVGRRQTYGGTAPEQVAQAVERMETYIEERKKKLEE